MPCAPPRKAASTVGYEGAQPHPLTYVAAACNNSHAREAMAAAVCSVVEHLDPPLSSLVRRGDRVLVKVNMGCMGFRDPEERFTSHPSYVEAIIECLLDCGAHVT